MGQLLTWMIYGNEEQVQLSWKTRLANASRYQYRGIISVLIAIILIIVFVLVPNESLDGKKRTILALWSIMLDFFLLTPMDYPVTGMMPVVVMPLFAVMSTTEVTRCYFSDTLALMLFGGIMSMITSNSGLDKRICLFILSKGSTRKFTGSWFIFKAGLAAFINAVVGNTLTSCATVYETLSSATENLGIRDYVNMAVQTSSTIGSFAPLHGSLTILAARAMYYEDNPDKTDFNYFHYAFYSVPICTIMFCANIMYYITLVKRANDLTEDDIASLQSKFQKAANDQPPINNHQYLATFFMPLYFIVVFLRGANPAWFNEKSSDATIAMVFIFLMHILPRNLIFLDVITAKKKSDLPELRPSSAILWWRYVDKNTPYAYMFLIGGGVALVKTLKAVALDISTVIPKVAVFIVSPLVSCYISHTATAVIFVPMLVKIKFVDAIIVGIGTSLGFTMPFRYAPSYFCYHNGHTSVKNMARIGIGSTAVCMIMLAIFGAIADVLTAGGSTLPPP